MIRLLALKLTALSIRSGAIAATEEELYIFSYETLLAQLSHWAALLVFGLLLHQIWGTLLFMAFFIPLRSFAGGFHERNYFRCFLSSLMLYGILVCMCPILAERLINTVLLLVIMLCSVILFLRAPVADPNKPLDDKEISKYKKTSRWITMIELFLLMTAIVLKCDKVYITFALAGLVTATVLVLLPSKQE